MKNIPIGEVLKQAGILTEEQILEALEKQKQDKNKRLGAILIEHNYISERQLCEALSNRLDLPVVDLSKYNVDIKAVALIPKQLSLKYSIVAISTQNEKVVIAVNDPLDFYAIEDIKLVLGRPCDIVIALKADIRRVIDHSFAEIEAKKAATVVNAAAVDIESNVEELVTDSKDDSPIVSLINTMLLKGQAAGASDIHIEPFETETVVRMRVDGQIVEYLKLSNSIHASFIARIKIMSDLDIAEKRIPQDGHFRIKINGIELNVRVSVLPMIFGEKAVLRFLGNNTKLDNVGNFGMSDDNYAKFSSILQNPHGIIYITGPTGSGKTTTLYMAIERLSKKDVNISTIEDPVEKNLPRINQSQVNNLAGLTFESGLRSLLRQDPDIILVGETRDNETARIAVTAAITGHLVMSTLHTNDAISAVARLIDMGVESYMIASSLVGVVAQRLVKKVCLECREEYYPTEYDTSLVGEVPKLYRARGCHICNNTGYKGRIGVHEVLSIDPAIRTMISRNVNSEEIYKYCKDNGVMTTLRDSLAELVRDGITTIDELLKLTYTAG